MENMQLVFNRGGLIDLIADGQLVAGRILSMWQKEGVIEVENEAGISQKISLEKIERMAAPRGKVCYYYTRSDDSRPSAVRAFERLENFQDHDLFEVIEISLKDKKRLDSFFEEGFTLSLVPPLYEFLTRSSSDSNEDFLALVCKIAIK